MVNWRSIVVWVSVGLVWHSTSVFSQIVPKLREEQLRLLLPQMGDLDTRSALSGALLFYTDLEMPSCYQDDVDALPGVHSSHYNISAESSERYGNGNREFPWGDTAGTSLTPNVWS